MSRDIEQLVEWHPELTPEEQIYADQLRAQTRPQLTFVRDYRKSLGLSQVEVADLLNMTQSNVSKTERKNDIPVSSLVAIAHSQNKRVRIVIENTIGEEEASFELS